MLIFPAIDLLDGQAVRLAQGDFQRVTAFGPDPVSIAHRYADAGAPWLHVVDLDGARNGAWQNLELIASIAGSVPIPIQAGGGARDWNQISAAFDRGIARVIVGTAAVESADRVAEWAAQLRKRLIVSLDVRDGRPLARGWTREPDVALLPLAEKLKAAGVARVIHTDIRRDGMLAGIDLSSLRALLDLGISVIVAGGVASYADIEELRDAGAEGVIIGRAFLEGQLDVVEAIRVASSA